MFHRCWFFTGPQGVITFWGSGSQAWGNRAPPAHSREALFPSASFPCFPVQCWTHLARGWVCDGRGGDLGAEGYNEPMPTPSARSSRMSAPHRGCRQKAQGWTCPPPPPCTWQTQRGRSHISSTAQTPLSSGGGGATGSKSRPGAPQRNSRSAINLILLSRRLLEFYENPFASDRQGQIHQES